ncbi:Cyclic nucleotide-binding domain protein [Legionella massiliensis]|uniref:Cyclic nucleotide-binding domain protein n=1 Tax=Legionella massiliensis TaxID=1034943 RepID=A0A078L319_9GAMM|nr:cyclic nucleotide-binding domain-containing protein [Legionella massiliensis]CDZ78499.1 Cyclic nucleotide-binding domain protein [Legionella massiliensis]CEE14237.1 Cyclic nucleotide-binding domain protein [Legionella massiliensis]
MGKILSDYERGNYYSVTLILVSSVSIAILLNTYSTALYLGNFSRSTLPYYFIVTSLISALSMVFLLPILGANNKKTILIVQAAAIALLVLFLIINGNHIKTIALIYSFLLIVLSGIFNATCWNIASSAFEFKRFKEYANQFLALSSIGSMGITALSYFAVAAFGENSILYLSTLMMVLNCIALFYTQMATLTDRKNSMSSASLKGYPIFSSLALFLGLINFLNILFNYQMMYILGKDHSMTEIAQFMTVFYLLVSGGSFIAQLISNRLLNNYGLSILFVLSTLCLVVLIVPSIFFPYLFLIALLNASALIVYASFVSLGRQISLNALPSSLKSKAQILIKAISNNLSRIAASLTLMLFAYHYEFYPYQLLSLIALGAMLFYGYKIKLYYGETLLGCIKERRFYLPLFTEAVDYHFLKQQVNELLTNEDSYKISIGLAILKWTNHQQIPQGLFILFESPEAIIRIKAYKALEHFPKVFKEDLLVHQIEKERDIEASWHLLQLIDKKYPEQIIQRSENFLVSSNPAYQAIAIIALIRGGELQQVELAIHTLQTLLKDKRDEHRLYALRVLKNIPIGNPVEAIQPLMIDNNYRIAKEAIQASKKFRDKRLASCLIQQLGKQRVSYDAARSLIDFKADVGYLLSKACLRANTHNYKPLIRVLCQINSQSVMRGLCRLVPNMPFLFSVELAKQIALQAAKIPLAPRLNQVIQKQIPVILRELAAYSSLVNAQKEDDKKSELLLRKHLIETKLICYLAAITDPQKIMIILPKLVSKQTSTQQNIQQELAYEYLDWLIKDRHLAKQVFDVVENKSSLTKEEISAFKFDPWTQRVLNEQLDERNTMETVDKVFALRKSSIFRHIPAELLIALAEECRVVQVPEQEVIYRVGDMIDTIYMILEGGDVQIQRKGKLINHAKDYDFLGLLTTLSDKECELDVISYKPTSLLALSKDVFNQLTEDYPDILRGISKYVVQLYYFSMDLEKRADAVDDIIC